jgi:predicted HTH transcriptional regulator
MTLDKLTDEQWSELTVRQSAEKGHVRSNRNSLTVVLDEVTRLAPVTLRDLIPGTGLNEFTVRRALRRLLHDKLVAWTNPSGKQRWYFPT